MNLAFPRLDRDPITAGYFRHVPDAASVIARFHISSPFLREKSGNPELVSNLCLDAINETNPS